MNPNTKEVNAHLPLFLPLLITFVCNIPPRFYVTKMTSSKLNKGLFANNHASFHMWWKKNLLNYQNVSKYYEHGCLENLLLLFMSLLTALIVKNSQILAGTYFIKKFLEQTSFNTKFWTHWKGRKSSYQVRQILAPFLKISCSSFRLKLRLTKIVQEIKSEEVWRKLEARNSFQRQSFTKHFGKTLVFMWNRALREKFDLCFSENFY